MAEERLRLAARGIDPRREPRDARSQIGAGLLVEASVPRRDVDARHQARVVAARADAVHAVEHLGQRAKRDRCAKMRCRRLFEVMGLIHDHGVGLGQGRAPGGEVAQQQGMIRDHDVRRFRGLAGSQEEAGAVAHVGAVAPREAVLALGAVVRPVGVLRV